MSTELILNFTKMKKLYTLLFAAVATFSVNAQNVVTNGSFETWNTNEPPAPDGWLITLAASGSVTQESSIVHTGASAVKLTAPDGTGNNRVGFTDIPVTAGTAYTIAYWYYDQDDNARFRHWGSWRNDTAALPTGEQSAEFQPSTYNANTTGWQFVTVTATAPAGATLLRVDFRVFKEVAAGGGSVYLDDVAAGNNLSVKQNQISGLSVYPNPVKKGGNLYITSDSKELKTVTIIDMLGKQVLNATVTDDAINVSHLKSGIYMAKITEAGKVATKKLVIE